MVSEAGPDGRTEEENGSRLTPVMRQYREMKEQHPDTILFFRIGDFYETFDADAELISRELEIVLTSRSRSGDNRIPLAGVPYHAADGYIAKLIGKGYKVAVCEQVGDAKGKGIVRREIVRVITPGTVIDSTLIPSVAATYLMAVSPDAKQREWGIALLDISTGEFFAATVPHDPGLDGLRSEIAGYRPAECIVPASVPEPVRQRIRDTGVVVTACRDELFLEDRAQELLCRHFHVATLGGFGFDGVPCAVSAAGAALAYAQETQHAPLPHISGLSMRSSTQFMMLDAVTLRNLEVRESIRAGTKGATLFSSLDQTRTPMGSRLLNRHLTRPLYDIGGINRRLDAVEFLAGKTALRLTLRDQLGACGDIERIAARIAYGNAGPRDLIALADTLSALPALKQCMAGGTTGTPPPALVSEALAEIRDLPEIIDLVRKAITEDPPAVARNGGVIRTGFSAELDAIRGVLHSGKDWIVELQSREREATGIRSLKIGYNRIFGYYIDITKPNVPLVPARYERRQTTATGERYTIPELREKEALITNADERVLALERELYTKLLETLRGSTPAFQAIANGIGALDVAAALAEVAQVRQYVRPQLDGSDAIVIRDGRHPVVEQGVAGGFIPNDTELSGSGTQIMIITGANMAGKSTYMRATALICIMAQAGSFVPARHARIGILDRIFTRVGAFDDLASGQSTFFVEMLELANILNNVTPRSLVILDEIGRGTSTADGSSIARAVLEYLHGKSGAGPKTLFATHFHELIAMEEHLRRVKNYHFAVKETKDEVVFLRKIIPGATDKSYGIHVARLAGIPKKVTERAEALLDENMNGPVKGGTRPQRYTQILLVDDRAGAPADTVHPVLEELGCINPDEMTPLQALSKIHELKRKLGEPGDKE